MRPAASWAVLLAAAAAAVCCHAEAATVTGSGTILNYTCFQICQQQSNLQPAGKAEPGIGGPSTHQQQQHASTAAPAGRAAAPPEQARRLLATNGSTTTSTSSTSTPPPTTIAGCAPQQAAALDPQAAALLAARYRGFKLSLGMSDFFELFYSIGNVWYAIDDLLKQGLAAMSTGHFTVNAEQVLLFNSNLASISAWLSYLVQNLLLLAGDQLLPLPTDGEQSP